MTSQTVPSAFELERAIADATRAAIARLFKAHPERFYCIALLTTGEAHRPCLAACSHEALVAMTSGMPPQDAEAVKWSFADSPYYAFADDCFDDVERLFALRPRLDPFGTQGAWQEECDFRIGAMERAIARLDREGVFGAGDRRNRLVVNVEVVPPDAGNAERAKRLNPPVALRDWLDEAAES